MYRGLAPHKIMPMPGTHKTLQLTQKASFVLCITLRFIFPQNKGRFLGI
jgi:hypothetical protein